MEKPLRAIVIGVGNMGRNHARIYSQHPLVSLVAVVDKNKQRARMIAKEFGVKKYYTSTIQCLEKEVVNIASTAVPPQCNLQIASALFACGIHSLIEKPLAPSVKDAEQIVQQAALGNVMVAVGHIEHCNPAVQSIKKIINDGLLGKIKYISAKRIGVPTPRPNWATNIIFDLGVHDIGVCNFLVGRLPTNIQISGKRPSFAIVNLNYSPILASLELNKISPIKKRSLEIFGDRGHLTADYITQSVRYYPFQQSPQHSDFRQLLAKYNSHPKSSAIKIKKAEPLKVEIDDFINSVINNRKPQTALEEALSIIRIAEEADRLIS